MQLQSVVIWFLHFLFAQSSTHRIVRPSARNRFMLKRARVHTLKGVCQNIVNVSYQYATYRYGR